MVQLSREQQAELRAVPNAANVLLGAIRIANAYARGLDRPFLDRFSFLIHTNAPVVPGMASEVRRPRSISGLRLICPIDVEET